MMQTNVSALLGELKEAMSLIYDENLRALYLYGSCATGDGDAESDVDVVIVLRDFADYWEEIERTSHVVSELSLKYNVSISPVRLRESDWLDEDSPFLRNVRKECVAL
jgi:predicted nucleotidyltransferase